MKRRIAVLLAVCLSVTGLLTACGGSTKKDEAGQADSEVTTEAKAPQEEATEVSSEELVTLTFPSIWVGSDSKAEAFGKMISDFNEENKGKIEILVEEQTDYDAYRDKIRTQISTGNAPDIFTVESFADVQLFAESGKLMDMTNFLAEGTMTERFVEGLVEKAKVNGVNYGFPYENAYIPAMYNMSLFEKAGITEIPKTYDELWVACEKLKEQGVFPITQMTNDNAWTSMLWYSYAVASCGGADVYERGLDDPAFVEAAEIIKKMFDYTSSDAIGADATVVNGHFFNERAAIYTNGSWILGRIQSEGAEGLFDSIEIGSSLEFNGENGGGYLNVVQAYICAGKQEDPAKEAAVLKFFEFITQEDKIVELSNSSGSTFAIDTDVANIENRLQAEIITKGSEANYTIGHFQGSVPTATANAFPAALESLVLGDVDAQGFVDILKAAK